MRSECHQCFFKHKLKNKITSENFQITSIVMPKTMQNLVVLMEPSENAEVKPLKGGNMFLNRFCIDEDAAFELSGVDYLTKLSWMSGKSREFEVERKVKGKDYSFLRSETFFIQFAELYLHKQFIIIPQKSILIRTLIILHYEKKC